MYICIYIYIYALHSTLVDSAEDLGMVIPSAWLSVFGKWLPLDVLQDLVPFLQKDFRAQGALQKCFP